MIGYKSSSSVWCASGMFRFFYVNVQKLSRMVKIELPATGRQENGDQTRFWNREIGHARIAEPMCTPPSSLGKKMIFRTFFRCCSTCQFLETFFLHIMGFQWLPQKKQQHIISPYERYLKTTHNHQPDARMESNHLQNFWHLRGGSYWVREFSVNCACPSRVGAWMS